MNDDLFSNVELISTDITGGLEKSNLLQKYLIESIISPTLSPTSISTNYSDLTISSRDEVHLTENQLTVVIVLSGFGFLLVVFLFFKYYCIKDNSKKEIANGVRLSNEIVNIDSDLENSSFYNVDTADMKCEEPLEEKIDENSLVIRDITLKI